jgi:hypothetical protein
MKQICLVNNIKFNNNMMSYKDQNQLIFYKKTPSFL